MNILYVLALYLLLPCSRAAVAGSHSHSHGNSAEREQDGAYRSRDADHYSDDQHNTEFDHEAILGSVKTAEEFDQLSPEESQRRLGLMLPKMDLNGDKFIDRQELKQWIKQSFVKLSMEEAQDRLKEVDINNDKLVTWREHLSDAFGVDSEDELDPEETSDSGMMLKEEREMFIAADVNHDKVLDINEFEVFTNPEEHVEMHELLIRQTLREKDDNKDGQISFQEFVGSKGAEQTKEWLVSEKEKFDHELDVNKDGFLDEKEIKGWIIPDNDEIADEEVEHLFAAADDDHDDALSFAEIREHFDVFVGSEATDYGNDLLGSLRRRAVGGSMGKCFVARTRRLLVRSEVGCSDDGRRSPRPHAHARSASV